MSMGRTLNCLMALGLAMGAQDSGAAPVGPPAGASPSMADARIVLSGMERLALQTLNTACVWGGTAAADSGQSPSVSTTPNR